MSRSVRLRHLSAYLQVLTADVVERGGFQAVAEDPIVGAAKALLSGAGSMLKVLKDDLKTLAGVGMLATKAAIRPVVRSAVADGVGMLFDKAFEKIFGK